MDVINNQGASGGQSVLIYNPYILQTPHLETDLEIADEHLQKGDSVAFVTCSGELPFCEANPSHRLEICVACVARQEAGLRLLSRRAARIPLHTLLPQGYVSPVVELDSIEDIFELRRLCMNGRRVGMAAAASLTFVTRDARPSILEYRNLLSRIIDSTNLVYEAFSSQRIIEKVTKFYVFNGRFATVRGAFEMTVAKGIPVGVQERGCNLNYYEVFENHLPHDLQRISERVEEAWSREKDSQRKEDVAKVFYSDRANALPTNYISFVAEQRRGMLPSNWLATTRRAVVFMSSEDEFASIGEEWAGPIYHDQLDGVQRLAEALAKAGDPTHLYVRLHPNEISATGAYKAAITALSLDNVTIIRSDEPVDSYALLMAADVVLSFGSTMGIEAVYWGKPSILLGKCFYRRFEGTYNPETHEDAVQMLRANLPPKNRQAALMYGFYLNTFGRPFIRFKASNYKEGRYRGVRVYPDLTTRAALWIYRNLEFGRLRLAVERLWWKRLAATVTKH